MSKPEKARPIKEVSTEELAAIQGNLYEQIFKANEELRNIKMELQTRLERVKDGNGTDDSGLG